MPFFGTHRSHHHHWIRHGDGRLKSSGAALAAAGMAQLIVTLDYWSAAIALPRMASDLGAPVVTVQWAITVYIITFCMAASVCGKLGDRYGRKRLLMIGIAGFGLTSVAVGLSGSFVEILAARAIQGIFGGMILPLSMAVVSAATPRDRLAGRLGILTGIASLGAAAGPVVGGLLTETWGWPWIFYLNLPVALISLAIVWMAAEESSDATDKGRLDVGGLLLLAGAIVSLSLLVNQAPTWGWASLPTMGLGSITIVLAALFVIAERSASSPIIELPLLKDRPFLVYLTAGSLSNFAWVLTIFNATVLLQNVRGYTPLHAGLFFIFLSAAVAIAGLTTGRLVAALGTKRLLVMALTLQSVATGVLYLGTGPISFALSMAIFGFGCGWSWSVVQAGGIARFPAEKVGVASSVIQTAVILIGAMAMPTAGAIVTAFSSPDSPAPGISVSIFIGGVICIAGIVVAAVALPRIRSTEAT
jgi:MFS family permease